MKDDFLSLTGGLAVLKAHDLVPRLRAPAVPRVGVIGNPRSHGNAGRTRTTAIPPAMIIKHEPSSRDQLRDIMIGFRAQGVELIVIDGGDGTVRDVLSAARGVYRDALPRIAVIPSGKTNALAADLGVPAGWTLGDAIAAHVAGTVEARRPVHVHWKNGTMPDQLGFILGLGAYSRATMLAQKMHKQGWFGNLAVVLTLIAALMSSIFGGPRSSWRRGDMVRASRDGTEIFAGRVFLMFASTLRRLPAGIAPFGPPRDGLKFLTIKAPPRGLLRHAVGLLSGKESPAYERDGLRRRDAERVSLKLRKGIILDGERLPGGHLAVSQGQSIDFVVPG